jgi:hypothetical protein
MQKISKGADKELDEVIGCHCSCGGGGCIPYIVPLVANNYVDVFKTDER